MWYQRMEKSPDEVVEFDAEGVKEGLLEGGLSEFIRNESVPSPHLDMVALTRTNLGCSLAMPCSRRDSSQRLTTSGSRRRCF